MNALLESSCPELKLLARGKVRDVYEVDAGHLLFVATDRISAFDVVMKNGIPGKGKLLSQISGYWFRTLGKKRPHHLVTDQIEDMPASVQRYSDQLSGRCQLVRKLKILPVEAIVRGYLAGSGWKSYQHDRCVCGIPLPEGLKRNGRLPTPLYTPSTKAELGEHDENISPEEALRILGREQGKRVAELAVSLYREAGAHTREKGIILADTKFEFGVDEQGQICLADELCTPDSSRFWPLDEWKEGEEPPSFDKQFIRNYLESISFDKQTPIELPEDVVEQSLEKYREACLLVTGEEASA